MKFSSDSSLVVCRRRVGKKRKLSLCRSSSDFSTGFSLSKAIQCNNLRKVTCFVSGVRHWQISYFFSILSISLSRCGGRKPMTSCTFTFPTRDKVECIICYWIIGWCNIKISIISPIEIKWRRYFHYSALL